MCFLFWWFERLTKNWYDRSSEDAFIYFSPYCIRISRCSLIISFTDPCFNEKRSTVYINSIGFGVLAMGTTIRTLFYVVILCGSRRIRRFGGACRLHLNISPPSAALLPGLILDRDNRSDMSIRNIRTTRRYISDDRTLHDSPNFKLRMNIITYMSEYRRGVGWKFHLLTIYTHDS
jgi:hypothetical protein